MTDLLTPDEARARLLAAIDEAGGVTAFAKLCGVTVPAVCQIVSGHREVGGKVGAQIGVERAAMYRLTSASRAAKVPTERTVARRGR